MSEPRPRIFLIDGSSYILHAFFAMPPLSNARGLPTNAILGFTNMLLTLVKQHRPEYIAVLLDAGRETFRNQMFAAYKGHRPDTPDLEKVRVLFKELGFFNLLKLLEFNQPA
jgi:DNA polymerase I